MVSEPDDAVTLTGQSYIYACNSSCQPAGTATVLYNDPDGVSQIAFDPWGNLFFTDANYDEGGANNEGNSGASSSSLWEIPAASVTASLSSGNPVATLTTPLQTFTNAGTPGSYDDSLAAVAVNQTTGTVYYGIENDGIYAIPNTQAGGPSIANQYAVSSQGAKALAIDQYGNLFMGAGSNGGTDVAGNSFLGQDAAGVLYIDNLTVPSVGYLGSSSGTATLVDNAVPCWNGTPSTFEIASSNASEFSATVTSGCSSNIGVSSSNGTLSATDAQTGYAAGVYTTSITFDALNAGTQKANLTVSDTANGGEGTAAVTGVATTTPETISNLTASPAGPYTYSASPQLTITVSVTNGPSDFPAVFSIASGGTGAGTLSTTSVSNGVSSATLTVTQGGTITISAYEPSGFDANNSIYYSESNTLTLPLTVNATTQSVTFTPISPTTYIYSPTLTIPLSASSSSGLPVTFQVDPSSTGNGTISTPVQNGNSWTATLTVTQACNTATPTSSTQCTIVLDANQAGNNDYQAAQAQQSIVVNQASQAVTFTPPAQSIYFIATTPGVTGGITVPVTATSTGSDNQIVFSVDPNSTITGSFGGYSVKGTTTTATLTIPAVQPNNATSGTIIIDATQAGSDNYAAVTYTYPAQLAALSILPPLTTQTISFNNPGTQVVGTPLSILPLATSGLPVGLTSSTTSVCTISGSTLTFVASGTCTIVAAQPGDNKTYAAAPSITQSFTVNPAGENPTFSVDLSLSSLTIEPGTSGTTQLTVTSSNNFTGGVNASCSGLPSGYTCSFNPSTLTIAANGAVTSTITVIPPATAALVRHGSRPMVPFTALAVAICFLGFRKRSRLQLLVVVALGMVTLSALSACGGTGSSSSSGSTATSSKATITVTAYGQAGASAFVQQTATLNVILE